jgi:hypothetical protein
MKLNKSQKQFLFEHCYVDAQVLDAAVEPGWMNYFIRCFNWKLEDVRERWSGQKYATLVLEDKDDKEFNYKFTIIFQDNDYMKLLKAGK